MPNPRQAACLLLALAVIQPAFATAEGKPLRLKHRVMTPERGSSLSVAEARRARVVLLQFSELPPPERLRAAGVMPLNYVPEQAVLARLRDGADPTSLPNLQWIGKLPAQDKFAAGARKALAAGAPATLLVEAAPDIGHPELEGLVASAGGQAETRQVLPAYMRIVSGEPAVFERLAADPRVVWIMPASERLLRDEPLYYCAGAVTAHGTVANFATVAPGWDGPGLGPANLTYVFVDDAFGDDGTVDIPAQDERLAVRAAMDEWESRADLTFTEVMVSGLFDQIAIQWTSGFHGDNAPFDGPGAVLAHAFFPSPPNPEPIAGDMHFDDDELWSLAGNIHQFTVALHELGHSLGLQHSNLGGAVMEPFYGGPVTGLHPDDIVAIRSLYSGVSLPAELCATTPVAACTPLNDASLKASIKPTDADKRKFRFKAQAGSTPPPFFGIPVATTAHSTCVYDASDVLILELKVDSDDGFWKQSLTNQSWNSRYRNNDGNGDGVRRVRQRSGDRTRVQVNADGPNLDDLDLAEFTAGGLTVQQVTTEDACVESVFPAGSIETDLVKGKLKARIKP